MNKLFSVLVNFFTFLNAALYLIYVIFFVIGYASLPIGEENMNSAMILLGCILLSILPFLGLWLGKNFNLLKMSDGYHEGTNLFFTIVVAVFTVVMLKIYYVQFLPTFEN